MIVALAAWGNSRLTPAERSMILIDTHSGEEVEPVVDAKTGRRLDDSDTYVFTVGPAASDAMRHRYATRPNTPAASYGCSEPAPNSHEQGRDTPSYLIDQATPDRRRYHACPSSRAVDNQIK
ncbi:hypothetical protein SAMN05216532_3885 [Streptomyces sp. 2231.1]|nr:hypothetical protein SAMN05216532_3885 [Streptomyces sp. 2231.1]